MDHEFHNEVLEQRCATCKAYPGSECRAYTGKLVYPPHQRRWVKVVDRHYKAYAKANKVTEE